MFAARYGHPSTVQKLLAAGADPTLKNQVSAAAAVAREGAVVGRRQGWGRGAALGPKPPAPRRRARPRVRASPDSLAPCLRTTAR